jgi:hypothetical protein
MEMMAVLGFYLIVIMAPAGTDDFKIELVKGPFPDKALCAAVGAYKIGNVAVGLAIKNPDSQVKATCINHAPDPANGEELRFYGLDQLYSLAIEGK